MRTLLLILLAFSFGYSQTKPRSISQDHCSIVKGILSHDKVTGYLHPESASRNRLYLIKNDFCNFTGNVLGIEVISVDDNKKDKNFIKVTSVKETDKDIVVTLDYPIEGALNYL